MRFAFQRRAVALLAASWLVSSWLSCSEGPGISGVAGSAAGTSDGKERASNDDGGSDDLGERAEAGDEGEQGGGGDEAKIVYPTFRFNGKGNSICGKMNHVTTINVETSYTEDAMVVKKTNSKVYCEIEISGSDGVPDDKCNEIANSQQNIDKRNQETTYIRLKGDELKKEKANGLEVVSYVVFSKEIRFANGRIIKLSKPVPVGVIPAPAGRYKNMETKSWTANANDGTQSFDVTVEVSKVSLSDTQAQLKIVSMIAQGVSNYTIYESWPMPAAATYTIDTEAQSIVQIDAQGKNGSGGQDRCTNMDTSTTQLILCDTMINGELKPGACQFGTNALK